MRNPVILAIATAAAALRAHNAPALGDEGRRDGLGAAVPAGPPVIP